jgi:predicted secreted protein
MIDWMSSSNGEDWGDDSFTLNEIVANQDVAYAWTTIANTEEATGMMIETHVVTRFQFNADGKIVAIANLREDRFILEQRGFSITR